MHLPRYPVRTGEDEYHYSFTSIGPKGQIDKLVVFSEMEGQGVYNLGFGDRLPHGLDIDDLTVSNNEDTNKVLATVAQIAADFLSRHPSYSVFASGSTATRTRLYQMGIGKHIDSLQEDFLIMGFRHNGWEKFAPSKNYEAFYVIRKH